MHSLLLCLFSSLTGTGRYAICESLLDNVSVCTLYMYIFVHFTIRWMKLNWNTYTTGNFWMERPMTIVWTWLNSTRFLRIMLLFAVVQRNIQVVECFLRARLLCDSTIIGYHRLIFMHGNMLLRMFSFSQCFIFRIIQKFSPCHALTDSETGLNHESERFIRSHTICKITRKICPFVNEKNYSFHVQHE